MRITYDPEVDALYIRFKETEVTTKHPTAFKQVIFLVASRRYAGEGNVGRVWVRQVFTQAASSRAG